MELISPYWGHIVTFLLGILGTYVYTYLTPKPKVVCWFPHFAFFHVVEPEQTPVDIRTYSLTVQNLGRRTAEGIEITFRQKPDYFQFVPGINYEEKVNSGFYVILIKSLGPKEVFTLQVLSYRTIPELLSVRYKDGFVNQVPIQLFRVYPKWVYYLFTVLMIVGGLYLIKTIISYFV